MEVSGNHFSMRLFRKVFRLNESQCFSPLALKSAYNLLENVGLIDKGKGFGDIPETGLVHNLEGVLDKNFCTTSKDYDQSKFGSISETLRISAKLFVSKECNVELPKDTDNVQKNSVQVAPFGQHCEITRQEINCWAFKSSNYKLKTLLPPFIIDEKTDGVLINFLNFHSFWKHKFDLSTIKKSTFHSSPNVTCMVDMMSMQNVKFLYKQNDDCQVLGIPYSTNSIVFFIVIPKDRYGLPWLVRHYETKNLLQLFTSTTMTDVDIEIPIFRLESVKILGTDFLLSIFNNQNTNIDNTKSSNVFIVHHTLFEITKDGTNEVVHNVIQNEQKINPQIDNLQCSQFFAHHSFLFAVVDIENGAILFLGQYCGNSIKNNFDINLGNCD